MNASRTTLFLLPLLILAWSFQSHGAVEQAARDSHNSAATTAPSEERVLPVPPPMPKRAIAPPTTAPAGVQLDLEDDGTRYTLFIPETWSAPDDGRLAVIMHFHGAVWFAIQEHLRHGLDRPLLCFALGEGSSTYARPFKDRERFGRIVKQAQDALVRQRGLPPSASIVQIDITSFSAGYGAVREIVQEPQYVELIRRIILADSLYAGWDPATTQPGATSRPAAENMDPWLPFVRAAARGEKTFVLTHSQVPTPYANTEACAKALIEAVGATVVPVERGALPATEDPDFPLFYRADLNGFHVWGYRGVDAAAHMTHPRHIAEIWIALDRADARTRRGSEIRRGLSMRDPPEVRQRKHYERLAAQIEPDLRGNPARLGVYLRFFEREIVRDLRLFACRITADHAGGTVTLGGLAEFPEQVRSLVLLLQTLGFDRVEDRVQMLPSPALGDSPFGVVAAARSFIYSAPSEPREVVNEVLHAETLYLLHTSDDGTMHLCHAPDGYVGWIRADDVQRLTADQFTPLVRGNGSTDHDARIEAIIAHAHTRLDQPYVWGGRSDRGVDCSGLVQTAFASQGIHLPRDAEQQALAGRLVATRWHRQALRRGDLLFFIGRRGNISHTAIYLGDDELIEAAGGSVKLRRFSAADSPDSEDYSGSFCFAKRILE